MQPTTTLPNNYTQAEQLDLMHNRRALIIMNIAAVLSLFLFGWLFLRLINWLRPAATANGLLLNVNGLSGALLTLAAVLLTYAVMIVLHEAAHGLFFYLITKSKPVFALRGVYAYAAAPQWYIPRTPYLVTCLAPIVLLSLLGLLLAVVLPPAGLFYVLIFLVTNASGAAGDLYVAVWLLMQPPDSLANDQGDIFNIYHRKEEPQPLDAQSLSANS